RHIVPPAQQVAPRELGRIRMARVVPGSAKKVLRPLGGRQGAGGRVPGALEALDDDHRGVGGKQMRNVTYVALSGHEDLFQLDEDADKELRRYLNRASARLRGDVDRGEVLSDLEQSIGENLALRAGAGSGRPFFSLADVSAVLDEIGAVETGSTEASDFRRDRKSTRLNSSHVKI